jgi:hypothetical protein
MLNYYVTDIDLNNPSFKWSQVLQCTYECDNLEKIYSSFKYSKNKLVMRYNSGQINLTELNIGLREVVNKLELAFPNSFNASIGRLGYYSERLLGLLYMQGKVAIEGYNAEETAKDRLALSVQAKVDREKELERLKQQEELEHKSELLRREANRTPITVGMKFKSKKELIKAFEGVFPQFIGGTVKRWEFIKDFIVVEKVEVKEGSANTVWEVKEVVREGGRRWK